jgi:uncharacterized protein
MTEEREPPPPAAGAGGAPTPTPPPPTVPPPSAVPEAAADGGQPTDAHATPPGPTSGRAREPILDVCRGFALLGILLINVELMRGPDIYAAFTGDTPEVSGADGVVGFLTGWLAAGKFLSSFAIMFGLGAALIAGKPWAAGRSPRRLLARRYAFLIVLGLAHMFLLFSGDILFAYGIAGLVLLVFSDVKIRAALWWAGGILGVLLVLGVGFTALMGALPESPADDPVAASMEQLFGERAADAVTARQDGTYLDVVVANAWEALFIQTSQLIVLPWVVALFLFGFAVGRTGIIQDLPAHRDHLRRAVRVALPLGLLLNLPNGFLGPLAMGAGMQPDAGADPVVVLSTAAQIVGAPILAVGYLGAVALLSLRLGVFRPLAAVGRMALTAYLLQSALALIAFAGFGLYGRLGTAEAMLVVVAVWGVLLVVCPLWLRRFEFGPAEWIWRAWTYRSSPARTTG